MARAIETLHGQIKNPRSIVFRRLLIKRRLLGTGLYEDDWLDITKDVIKWGTLKKELDSSRLNQFRFSGVTLVMSNETGKYNPHDDENSLWYNYGDQQRTLVRIEAGFTREFQDANGIWHTLEFPASALWDVAYWDTDSNNWDTENVTFSGIISGDINVVGTNQINIPVAPLTEVFRQFSARRLSGYNSSLTASDFMEMLRDQQDSSGNYIFRPFFGNTTGNWDIQTTTVEYANLNTTTAEDVLDKSVWDIVTKLAEAENFVPFVTTDGKFKFVARDSSASTPVYSFFGAGGYSSEYGTSIKKINWYGRRYTKYYSRVQLRFRSEDTSTSYAVEESDFAVSGASGPWTLGERTLQFENLWIPTSTVAETIAQQIFDEYSAIRYEIDMACTFIPHLDLLDRVLVTYDASGASPQSSWDVYDWGSDTTTVASTELIWDSSRGDAIKLLNKEFRLISIELNLDTGESKFIGRE